MGKSDRKPLSRNEILDIIQSGIEDSMFVGIAVAYDELIGTWQERISSSTGDFPNSGIQATPSQRARWLDRNLLKPGQKLLTALEDDKRPYLSNWGALYVNPKQISDKKMKKLKSQLASLHEYVDQLWMDLNSQIAEGAPITGEMRYEIVFDLVKFTLENCPHVAPTRGTYDGEDKRWVGDLPEFVTHAYHHITNEHGLNRKGIDDLLRIALKDYLSVTNQSGT
ncbi:hypothetical protein [Yoonia sp. 208BN28-4]|uniref:hypothetical protein n=1 Tax=Yoonia sp. 208BN28-4 TaxID=3126505 RepID=UPI0030A33B88